VNICEVCDKSAGDTTTLRAGDGATLIWGKEKLLSCSADGIKL